MLQLFLQQPLAQEARKLYPTSATISPLSLTGNGIIGRLHRLAWRKHSCPPGLLSRLWCWLGCSPLFDIAIAASLLPLLPSTILLAHSQLQLRLLPRFHKHKSSCAPIKQRIKSIPHTHRNGICTYPSLPTRNQVQQRNRGLYHTDLPTSTPKPWHPLSPSR